jgi:hypothetical protein
MPGGHPGAQEQGAWRFEDGGRPRILLTDLILPVELRGQTVSLSIDPDRGQYYSKTK